MLKLRHLLAIFIPAILIIVAVFFVRIIQYQPLYPKQSAGSQKNITDFTIPIFSTDPVLGDRQAPATLIVFSDLGCALCREEFSIWQQLLKTYPKKFKIIWKALPVTQIPYDTRLANSYAYCANEQEKFVEFASLAFQNNDNLSPTIVKSLAQNAELQAKELQKCLNSGAADLYLQQVEQLATLLNVQAVPTVFLNNKQIEIPQIAEGWKTLLGL